MKKSSHRAMVLSLAAGAMTLCAKDAAAAVPAASAPARSAMPVAVAGGRVAAPAAAAGAATTAAADAARPKSMNIDLQISPSALDMASLSKNHLSYQPAALVLIDSKPAAITREPAYKGKPKYGAFQIGNGPKSVTYFSVDEPQGDTGKLYVDRNQNGDLSDDGNGEWDTSKTVDGIANYNAIVPLHASWGSAIREDESGTYNVMLYKRHGDGRAGYVKTSARAGKMEIDGKSYNFLLVENTNDGIFSVPARIDRTRRPVQLMVDINGDGLFSGVQEKTEEKTIITREIFTLGEPFNLLGQWWQALPSASGGNILIGAVPSPDGSSGVASGTIERSPLLAAGTLAPDFIAQSPEGKPVKLSDFKGKVVILDFWATWCGPCKVSMPGLQKIYDDVRDQGVVVLSLNVWDEKSAFDSWVGINSGKVYNFTFAFDPAGRDKESIASSKYNVSGIPTMYIINRDGKVVASLLGSNNERNIIKSLTDLGIKAKPFEEPKPAGQ